MDNVVLIGLMGSGKSAAGAALGRRLGLDFLDLDQVIEKQTGSSVADIFAREGESGFRERERRLIGELPPAPGRVIAAGGGAVLRQDNVRRLRQLGAVVYLHVSPAAAFRRLGRDACRPLLQGQEGAETALRRLARERLPLYRQAADYVLDTSRLGVAEVTERLARLWSRWGERRTVAVNAPSRPYQVCVGDGMLRRVGEWWRDAGMGGRVFVVADARVARLWGNDVLDGLTRVGFDNALRAVPPGERSKTLRQAWRLLEWLAAQGARRDDSVIGFGGGVVCDLAGFVASTYMRGVRVVHVPTTLIAQADAAVGGKTGVDLPAGKNLVGTFHQPWAVLVDPLVLRTLPARDLKAGLAEAVKYGAIADVALLGFLGDKAQGVLSGDSDALREIIERCCAMKARFVEQDEREQSGFREGLNFGHTFAHALETAGGFRRFRHGEAVGLGMMAAAQLSVELGCASAAEVERLQSALQSVGLPVRVGGLNWDAVMGAMRVDKKAREQGLRFVVLDGGLGRWRTVANPPAESVERALARIRGGD